MLRSLRRAHRLLAPFAVAIAAMVVFGSIDWWHADDNDAQDVIAFHDHAAHHPLWGTARSANQTSEHCYLCHWLRTLRVSFAALPNRIVVGSETRVVFFGTFAGRSALSVSHLPARAPPA